MKEITKKKWIVAAIAGIGIGILKAVVFEKYFFEIKHIRLGKTESKNQIKLLFLTDLHIKKYLDPSYKKLAKHINSINPDLILISGDVIDEGGLYAPAKHFFELVNNSIPKMAIMGNHDHKNRVRNKTYQNLFKAHNCQLLTNESKVFVAGEKRLMITGVDDFIEGIPSFAKAVAQIGREENHILLIHSPLQQETILKELEKINETRREDEKLNIQYILAGHNHGGQVTLFGYAPILPIGAGNYLKGWYNNKPPFLYLSRGFGTSTIPVRFNARSEVTVFHLGV